MGDVARPLPVTLSALNVALGVVADQGVDGETDTNVALFNRSASGAEPAGRGATRPRTHGAIDFGPATLDLEREEDKRPEHDAPRKRLHPGAVIAWAVGLGMLVLVVLLAQRATRVELTQTDLEDGAALNAEDLEDLEVRMELASEDVASSAALYFEDEQVEEPEIDGELIIWRPEEKLEEGNYELELTVPRMLLPPAEFVWRFEVDTTAPEIDLPRVVDPVPLGDAVTITGTIEPGAELEAGAGTVTVDDDGNATVEFAHPPAGPVTLAAIDRAGNSAASDLIVPVAYPKTRSVQMSAAAWAEPRLRGAVLQMAEDGRLDAVVLELKDAGGTVGFNTSVEQASQIGARRPSFNLADAVEALHKRDVRVIGWVSTFRDPVLAGSAWGSGDRDQVLQGPAGQPYGSSPEYTNFAHPAVQQYNLDIALDAVDLGVDEIIWVGVRNFGVGEAVVPALDGSSDDALAGFLSKAHVELRRRGAYQGVHAPGYTIIRPDSTGQDLALQARHVDYVVPETYPADWQGGNFNVANPIGQPAELVAGAIKKVQELTESTGTAIMPSLQDGRLGYGDPHVRAEIAGAESVGVNAFILSSPNFIFSAGALDAS